MMYKYSEFVAFQSERYQKELGQHFNESDNCDKNKVGAILLDILKIIYDLYCIGNDESIRKKNYESIKQLLDKYDIYISDFEKLNILLHINDYDVFNYYFSKHKDIFGKTIENVILYSGSWREEFFVLRDVQDAVDRKYGIGKYKVIELDYVSMFNSYNIFSAFRNKLKVYERFSSGFNNSCLFGNMCPSELSDLVLKENENNGEYLEDLLETLVTKFISNETADDVIYKLLNQEKIRNLFFNGILKRFMKLCRQGICFSDSGFDKIFKMIQDECVKLSDNINDVESFYTVEYFSALRSLKRLTPKERKESSLYLKCFKLFLEQMISNFSCPLENEDVIILSNLFHRLIERELVNFKEIFSINKKEQLYHYFKTNELRFDLDASLDQIKKYSVKQYLSLLKQYDNKSYVLSALLYFGYDFLLKTNLLSSKSRAAVIEYVKNKESGEIEKFKKFLESDFSVLDNKKHSIDKVISMYDYLNLNGVKKISVSKVVKCLESYEGLVLPNNRHICSNLSKLNFVSKGDPLYEKVGGILLYNEYRNRVLTTIPDISGKLDNYSYQMVDLHDPDIISNGIGNYVLNDKKYGSSCLTPNGKAASCLKHGATDVNGRFFKIEKDDKIVAYSWVWRCGDVLCFDNVEVTKEFLEDIDYQEILFNVYKKVADKLVEVTSKIEDRGIKLVVIGRNPIDVKVEQIERLPKVNDYTSTLFKPNTKEELYLKDSEEVQVIISGCYSESLNLQDVEPIYKCTRKKTNKFGDLGYKQLSSKINAIYFDYCIEKNIKYKEISLDDYVDGFINEDWFVGIRSDGKRDSFYSGDDNRLFDEMKKHTTSHIQFGSDVAIIKPSRELISAILDIENYKIDSEQLCEYLQFSEGDIYNSDSKYLHGASDLSTIASIMIDGRITSSYCGNRREFGLNNGRYFISLAKKEKDVRLVDCCIYLPTFVLDEDMCVFPTKNFGVISDETARMFVDTSYPIRPNLVGNEYQVLNSICLERADAIVVSSDDWVKLAKLIVLQDYIGSNLRLVGAEKEQIIDKEEVKKYIKFIG